MGQGRAVVLIVADGEPRQSREGRQRRQEGGRVRRRGG